MAAYLAPDWVNELDAALKAVSPVSLAEGKSASGATGSFRIVEEITGVPADIGPSVVSLVVEVTDAMVSAHRVESADVSFDDHRPAVTLVLDYAQAASLAAGTSSSAAAIGSGQVKVRGDVSLLVAFGDVISAAASAIAIA